MCSIVATEFLMDGSCGVMFVGIWWIMNEQEKNKNQSLLVDDGTNKPPLDDYTTLDYTIIELATAFIIVNQVNLL